MWPISAIRKRFRRRKVRRAVQRHLQDFAKVLEGKLTARRAEWDKEDAELRAVMAAAGGATTWGQLMERLGVPGGDGRKSLGEMAGGASVAARFDSALTTTDNQLHWAMADSLAPDSAASEAIRCILRNRSRYEVHNNCYARGVGETIANDFAGTGPRLHIDDERLTVEERADAEAKFAQWAIAVRLAAKLRTMRKARRQDGETFAVKVTNPGVDHPIKLDLRLIETDQVRDTDLALGSTVDGIKYDPYGNPVSYNVLRVHPGHTGAWIFGLPYEADLWPARLVIHWFREDRPGQHHGLPEILPALPLYATLRRYTQAVLDAAETAADFAVLIETQSGAAFYDDDGQEIQNEAAAAFTTQALERRMIAALPGGYTAKQFQPAQPQQEYSPFKREVCGEIGRCEGVPLNLVLGTSDGSSFASGQLDHKIYFGTRTIERSEADGLILDNLLADWIAEGVRIEDGKGGWYLPRILKQLGTSIGHTWHWDSNELGDPLKLAAANATDLKNGLTTIPALWEKRGGNWMRAFKAAARSLGVTFEEFQELVRESIFATSQIEEEPEGGDSATPKPKQAAVQKATASGGAGWRRSIGAKHE